MPLRKSQKAIVCIAFLLGIAAGLFPPWRLDASGRYISAIWQHGGYGFIGSPPWLDGRAVTIDFLRLAAEYLVITIAAAGFCIADGWGIFVGIWRAVVVHRQKLASPILLLIFICVGWVGLQFGRQQREVLPVSDSTVPNSPFADLPDAPNQEAPHRPDIFDQIDAEQKAARMAGKTMTLDEFMEGGWRKPPTASPAAP